MTVEADEIARFRAALIRIVRLVDREVQGEDLTATQQLVLGSLDRGGPVPIGELAELEHINPTMLSRIVGKLELAGLVRRQPDHSDGRVVRVEITAAGIAMQEQRRAERTRLLAAHISDLPESSMVALLIAVPALEELGDHLSSAARGSRARA